MNTIKHLLPFGLCVSAVAVSAAMPPNDSLGTGDSTYITCHAIARTPGAIGSACALHFDADHRMDVLVRVGGDLVYLSAPDSLQFSMICRLTGVTAYAPMELEDSWVNGAAFADAEGLHFVERTDLKDDSFDSTSASIGGAAWAGARALLALDLNGDKNSDVVGLDATGTQLLTTLNLGGGTWAMQPSVALGVELSSLAHVQLGGVSGFAGVAPDPGTGADAVVCIDPSGMPLLVASVGGSIDGFAVIRDEGASDDSFALLLGDRVTVMDAGGAIEPGLLLTAEAPSSISTADVDGDGRDDVLANSTAGSDVTALLRIACTGASLHGANVERFSFSLPDVDWSQQRSAPLAADFDNDGDVDVLQFIDSERAASLCRSAQVEQNVHQVELLDAIWDVGQTSNTAELSVQIPPQVDGSAPDYLEILFSSNSFTAPGGDTRQEFHASRVFDVSSYAPGDTAEVSFTWVGEVGSESSLNLRVLDVDETGTIVDRTGVARSYFYGAATDDSGRGTELPLGRDPFPDLPPIVNDPPPPTPGVNKSRAKKPR